MQSPLVHQLAWLSPGPAVRCPRFRTPRRHSGCRSSALWRRGRHARRTRSVAPPWRARTGESCSRLYASQRDRGRGHRRPWTCCRRSLWRPRAAASPFGRLSSAAAAISLAPLAARRRRRRPLPCGRSRPYFCCFPAEISSESWNDIHVFFGNPFYSWPTPGHACSRSPIYKQRRRLYRYLGPKSTAYQQHLKNAVLNTSTEVPSVGPENSAYLENSKINSPSSTFDQSFVGFSLSSRVGLSRP